LFYHSKKIINNPQGVTPLLPLGVPVLLLFNLEINTMALPIFLTLVVLGGLYLFYRLKQPVRFIIFNPDNIHVGFTEDNEYAKILKSRGYTVAREVYSRRGTYFKPI
jgi:hypothetical protein